MTSAPLTAEQSARVVGRVDDVWRDEILPTLVDYVRIPCVSVQFDPDWKANGHLDLAVTMMREWCETREIEGLVVEVHELPGRTPLILCEVPAFLPAAQSAPAGDTVMLYGHCDKQPEMTGWLRKFASAPSRSRPMTARIRPDRKASVIAAVQ